MKVEPVIMSSGELESEIAGNPGYLIRKRYRKAADMSKARGILSALLVNDIDAGLGRFEVRSSKEAVENLCVSTCVYRWPHCVKNSTPDLSYHAVSKHI
jgi:hypothetical protein